MTGIGRGLALIGLVTVAGLFPAAAASDRSGDLMKAAEAGNLAKVKELIVAEPALAKAVDAVGKTALHRAATKEVATALIAAHADVNATAGFGQTPLWEAATDGRKSTVEALLAGARVDAPARDGSTALHRAALFNEAAIAQLLIAAHADLGHKDDRGRTPLALAAGNCKTALVGILVNAGADVNARDGEGKTPRELAARCAAKEGREAILAMLHAADAKSE